jgi:hypothetical protein
MTRPFWMTRSYSAKDSTLANVDFSVDNAYMASLLDDPPPAAPLSPLLHDSKIVVNITRRRATASSGVL